MRHFLLLLFVIPSLASAQITPQHKNGWVKSLQDAVQTIRDGATPTFTNGTRLSFGVTRPIGTPCIRCTIRLTPEQATFLSIPPAVLQEPADYYAAMQVCGPTDATGYPVPDWLSDLLDTCSKTPVISTAVWPSVIIASRLDPQAQNATTGFACACSTGTNCNWTPPLPGGGYGASTPAPKNMTIPPGLYSGTGCLFKTCLELYGSESMPNACK